MRTKAMIALLTFASIALTGCATSETAEGDTTVETTAAPERVSKGEVEEWAKSQVGLEKSQDWEESEQVILKWVDEVRMSTPTTLAIKAKVVRFEDKRIVRKIVEAYIEFLRNDPPEWAGQIEEVVGYNKDDHEWIREPFTP